MSDRRMPNSLRLEPLDARNAPVVGAFAEAPAVAAGDVFDGVVQVHAADGVGTGTLLYTGRHVLTAAHLVDGDGDQSADSDVTVRFDLAGQSIDMPVPAERVLIWPGWTGLGSDGLTETGTDDLALLELPALAPSGPAGVGAGRFDLYRGFDEVGQVFLAVGYGRTGLGAEGYAEGGGDVKRYGYNLFETTGLTAPGEYLVPPGYGLVADFDSGNPAHDALGRYLGLDDLGEGADEAAIAFGDSGGSAFLYDGQNYLLAGVAASLVTGGDADIDVDYGFAPTTNSSFGDLMGYPELAEAIREVFPALEVMEEFGSVASPGTDPHVASIPQGPVPEQLGDFRVLREVGRGGMGIVYEAVQESLGRHVALKVLPPLARGNPTYLERFRREAKAAAKLHHTNIVPVFGIGAHEGVPYYAMQFIRGQTLDAVLKELLHLRETPAPAETLGAGADRDHSVARGLLTGRFEPDAGPGTAPR